MSAIDRLLQRAQAGFVPLDLPDTYKDAALKWLARWLKEPVFDIYRPQLTHLIESERWEHGSS